MIHFRRLSFSRNQSLEVSGKGTYVLVLRLSSSLTLPVGRLGECYLTKGYYIYVGSAFGSGGLAARLRHHLKVSLTPHWHIENDHLRKEEFYDDTY